MKSFTISWDDFQSIQLVWIAVAMSIFFLLLKVTAPYGRHTSANWGPLISNHMGWLLMELPVLIALFIFLLPEIKTISTKHRVRVVGRGDIS